MKHNSTLIIAILFFTPHVFSQSEPSLNSKASVARVGEYIIKMKSDAPGKQSVQQQKSTTAKAVRILSALGKDIEVKRAFSSSSMVHLKTNSQAKVDFLKNHPDVEFIEPNYILSIEPLDIQPFGMPPTPGDTYTQSGANVKVNEAWAIAKPYNHSTPKVIVAVIDTGLDLTHGVFADSNSIWTNSAELGGLPGVDDDHNGYVDDLHGWNFVSHSANMYDDGDHGTHVAGIVLGVGQDILAYPVRESRMTIMPLKFLDGNGSGSTADAISAIDYAVFNGAKVINNSWGGPSYSRSLHEAYANAYAQGVVIVSAAGNSNLNVDISPMYPAVLDTPNNIAVAATSDSDSRASFSNYSPHLVHVAAPGVAITSPVPGVCSAPGCFQMMSGTSMATPFVAGMAALIIREAPQLSPYQVKGIITSQVDVVSGLSTRVQTSGRVNVLKSIQSAIANVGTANWSPAYVTSATTESSSTAGESTAPKAGCGLVQSISSGSASSTGFHSIDICIIFSFILLPLGTAMVLGRKKKKSVAQERAYVRKFERFKVAKEIVIKVGDEAIKSVSDSISVGGLSFENSELNSAQFQKGQKIKVQIDGHSDDIEAQIVWCNQKKSFGVQFLSVTDQLKSQMQFWTAGLSPT